MNTETPATHAAKQRAPRWPGMRVWRFFRRHVGSLVFSSIGRRILFLNLAGFVVLVTGILYMNQYRAGLIDYRMESLITQAKIIAGAISASATVDTNSLRIDPERLLEIQAGESVSPSFDPLEDDFPIDIERVAPVLRSLITPTRTRARIYDSGADLILDSKHLYYGGQILRYELPPPGGDQISIRERIVKWTSELTRRRDLPTYTEEPGGSGTHYPEVMSALTGSPQPVVRITEQGELIVSVAVPIQRYRSVVGVLMLSTEGGDIDAVVAAERQAILPVFGVAAAVIAILSLLLASTIANPLRRLSAAAVRVGRGANAREVIPHYDERSDEIGLLSTSLREMTNALSDRIDAIESFAADVAHELKNPLTSLRSAVETLPLAKNQTARERLLDVIQHDVKRLDRLITDISDASRLDAELARQDAAKVDLRTLLRDLVAAATEVANLKQDIKITLNVADAAKDGYIVNGHDLRIGQVISNLIGNARSFVSPSEGKIDVSMQRKGNRIIIAVEDNGPGIRTENIESIFERFYTDRPAGEAFGQNSGLGLSISRQIIEAHGGTITAHNIAGSKPSAIRGACFTIVLPAAKP